MGKRKRFSGNVQDGAMSQDEETLFSPMEDNIEEEVQRPPSRRSLKLLNDHSPPSKVSEVTEQAEEVTGLYKTFQGKLRPSKKSRKDSEAQLHASTSGRKLDMEHNGHDKCSAVEVKSTVRISRTKRPWELWSSQDKVAFFEGLNEFGKDFESIQNHIANKVKKKGVPQHMIKNKDQVRHFYYRTWHKISKHLNMSNEVKKGIQEIYGLVNYGELRKKLGASLNEKSGAKLNELVYHGVTNLKVKGKNFRIRTPPCKALKRINKIEDNREDEVRIPTRVHISLQPARNCYWYMLAAEGHTPSVRATLPLQYRLQQVIHHLERKWRLHRHNYKNQLLNATDADHHELRLIPKLNYDIKQEVSVETNEVTKSAELSLRNYTEKFGLKSTYQKLLSSQKKNDKSKETKEKELKDDAEDDSEVNKDAAEAKDETASVEDDDAIDADVEDHLTELETASEDEEKKDNESSNDEKEEEASDAQLSPVAIKREPNYESTMCQLFALATAAEPRPTDGDVVFVKEQKAVSKPAVMDSIDEVEVTTAPSPPDVTPPDVLLSPTPPDVLLSPPLRSPSPLDATEAAAFMPFSLPTTGLTKHNCGTVTMGELYMRLGRPEKLVFEYEFVDVRLQNGVGGGSSSSSGSSTDVQTAEVKVHALTDLLTRLLDITKTAQLQTLTKNANKIPVRHRSESCQTELSLVDSEPGERGEVFLKPAPPKRPIMEKVKEVSREELEKCMYLRGSTRKPRPNKGMVVQRLLPLMPNKLPIGRSQTLPSSLLQPRPISSPPRLPVNRSRLKSYMNNITAAALPVTETPIMLPTLPNVIQVTSAPWTPPLDATHGATANNGVLLFSSADINKHIESSPVVSEPNMSVLLEISLPSSEYDDMKLGAEAADKLMDMSLDATTFNGFLPRSSSSRCTTPDLYSCIPAASPGSPSAVLRESNDNRWLEGEVHDYSLSSLLGNLDTQEKLQLPCTVTASTIDTHDESAQMHFIVRDDISGKH